MLVCTGVMHEADDAYSTWLAFFQEFFEGEIYCYANFFCYANFSVVFGPNFREAKVFEGGKLPQGDAPCPPPVEESQPGHLVVLLPGPISHTRIQYIDYIEFFNISLDLSPIYLLVLVGVVLFSGVELSIRSFYFMTCSSPVPP